MGKRNSVVPCGVVPLTPAIADALARRLAPAHVREIRELSGLAPRAALRFSLTSSLLAYAVFGKAEPVFAAGVEPAGLLTGTAQVWMTGTPEMAAHAWKILRCAAWGLETAFAATGAELLEQYIPAWYGTGIRFAQRTGFRVERTENGIAHVVLEKRIFENGKEERWAYPQ